MEIRNGKISIGKAGGTAGKSSITCKVSIPSKWVRELKLDGDNREINLSFDGRKIVISKAESIEEFIEGRKTNGELLEVRYYSGNTLMTIIYADMADRELRVKNFTDNENQTAFPGESMPMWEDFISLLKSRCLDENSPRIRDYLMSMGLKQYDPFAIIKKTKGRLMTDDRWMSISNIK